MSQDPAPAERAPGTGAALSRGALTFLLISAPAAVLALANAVASGEMPTTEIIQMAAVYLGAFFRVGLETSFELLAGQEQGVSLAAAPMLGTALAVWLLFRLGRRLRSPGTGGKLAHAAAAAATCAVLAIGTSAASILWPLDSVLGPVSASFPSVALGPLALCFVPTLLGASWPGVGDLRGTRRRAVGAFAGAWAMLVVGVAAAFLALVLLAALAPGYSRVYLAGFRAAKADWGASAVANNAAFLPNEATWALTASMGACAGIYGGDSDFDVDIVCRTRFPSGISDEAIDPGIEQVPAPRILEGVPLVLAIFALVAPTAVLTGGWIAGRVSTADRLRSASAVGASAGLLFAPLAVATAWFSGVDLTVTGGELEIGHVFIGPRLGEVLIASLLWGVVGGAMGAALRSWWKSRKAKAPDTPPEEAAAPAI